MTLVMLVRSAYTVFEAHKFDQNVYIVSFLMEFFSVNW